MNHIQTKEDAIREKANRLKQINFKSLIKEFEDSTKAPPQ